jgi:hypothetical protein
MKIPGSQPSNRPVMAESTTELLILADGKILVHNLTPAFADLLTQLNPEEEQIRLRANSTAHAEPPNPKPTP